MWNRRSSRAAQRRADPDRGAAQARVPRLRLGRHRDHERHDGAGARGRPRCRPGSAHACGARRRADRHRAHALGHARRRHRERTRTRTSRPARTSRSRWCTTASSRTTRRCASDCKASGYQFASDTDTEVIAHLVHSYVVAGSSLFAAVQKAVRELEGAYAIAAISKAEPNTVVGSRRGSPLLLGIGNSGSGKGENFLASDTSALLQVTRTWPTSKRATWSRSGPTATRIVDGDGKPAERPIVESQMSADAIELGKYQHFMQKEIFEQPGAVANTLEMVANAASLSAGLFGAEAEEIFARTKQVLILACGTSYHAGCVAKYWIESIAGVPVSVEIASEYRYRDSVSLPNTLVITDLAIGRNRRHAGRAAARQVGGPARHAVDLQRAGIGAHPPEQAALPDPRRPGDRRRVDQGVHHPARGAVRADAGAGQAAQPAGAGAREGVAGATAPPAGGDRPRARMRAGGASLGQPFRAQAARAVPRPRRALPDRARRRAEAEGSHLHPCRGLRRRRTEARTAGADRPPRCRWWSWRPTTRCSRS